MMPVPPIGLVSISIGDGTLDVDSAESALASASARFLTLDLEIL
jgi:hypothetical protein